MFILICISRVDLFFRGGFSPLCDVDRHKPNTQTPSGPTATPNTNTANTDGAGRFLHETRRTDRN